VSAPTPGPGPALSPVVAGCWQLHAWGWTPQERLRWIEQSAELGVTSFDHADIYGDHTVEGLFGEALRLAPGLRQRLQLVSKCGIRFPSPHRPGARLKHYDSSAEHVRDSVERSLRALGTDHLDLLLIHRPDALMDADALAACFEALRRQGKVRHFGVSNHSPEAFARLHRRIPLVTNQIEFSPLRMAALADGTLTQAADLGLRPMVWSPLARGRLFEQPGDDQVQRVRAVLERQAQARGVSAATMAFAWILRHPSRPIPVAGTRRIEALREALAATQLAVGAEEWYEVWQASMGREVD
jgi:predicted oxidoreductase